MSSDSPTDQPSVSQTAQQQQILSSSTTTTALAKNGPAKITVLLKAAGNAPILKSKNWEMDESRTVAYLTQFLRKILQLTADQSLFVFVNQSFAPSPDHTIGVLYNCFGGGNSKLTIHYSTTMAWG